MATKDELKALGETVKADIAKLEARMVKMMYFQAMVLVGILPTVLVRVL